MCADMKKARARRAFQGAGVAPAERDLIWRPRPVRLLRPVLMQHQRPVPKLPLQPVLPPPQELQVPVRERPGCHHGTSSSAAR